MENRNWKEYKLSDICNIISTKTSIQNATLENYISTENMINDFGGVQNAEKLPTTNTVNSFFKDDILFSNIRTYFKKVWYAKFDGTVSQDVLTFRAKEDIFSKFLYYILCNPEFTEYTVLTSKGAKMPRGDKDAIKDFELQLPPLPEQKVIASVLSSLDDKIDLLHQQNQTLEALAETLFRQWFIEEAKEDWEEGKLGDEFDFTMGQSPPSATYNENGEGIPLYQGNADFGFRFPTNRIFTTEPKRFAEKHDSLISVRAPVGAQNMANERCCIGRGVAAFRYKEDQSKFSYTYYKLASLMNEIKQFNEAGTVFGSISKSDFENIDILIPPKNLIEKFQNEVKPIDLKIFENSIQIQTLTQLRDTLLPKLMNGEVRVNKV